MLYQPTVSEINEVGSFVKRCSKVLLQSFYDASFVVPTSSGTIIFAEIDGLHVGIVKN